MVIYFLLYKIILTYIKHFVIYSFYNGTYTYRRYDVLYPPVKDHALRIQYFNVLVTYHSSYGFYLLDISIIYYVILFALLVCTVHTQ